MAQPNVSSQIEPFLDEKRIKGRWPLKRIFLFIKQLTSFDLIIEKKIKTYTGVMIAFFVISFLSVFIVAFLGKPMAFLIIPVFIILGIIFLVLMLKYKKMDLSNEFREFVFPLLEQLKDDIKESAHVLIDLPLDQTESDDYSQGKSDKYSAGQYHKCFDHYYERDFIMLGIPLHDGNKLMLHGHEFLIKQVKTKRNPRGKIKTKTKYKKKVTFTISLRVNPQRYSFKAVPDSGPTSDKRSVSIKDRPKDKEIRLTYQVKLKEELVPDWQHTLSNIVSLYSYLEPVQTSA